MKVTVLPKLKLLKQHLDFLTGTNSIPTQRKLLKQPKICIYTTWKTILWTGCRVRRGTLSMMWKTCGNVLQFINAECY